MEQIAIVVHNLGTPTDETWPNRNEMPDYNKLKFTHCNPVPTSVLLPDIDELLVDLVGKLILYNADKRLNAQEVLINYFFSIKPQLFKLMKDFVKQNVNFIKLYILWKINKLNTNIIFF